MDHNSYQDSYIRGILNTVKTIAMVGVSPKTNRPSYFAFKYLLERGYRMIPVNPGQAGGELLGQKVYAKLADIPEPVDMVDVFRASEHALGVAQDAVAMNSAPEGAVDAAWRAQRRGRKARRGQRDESGDEPLSQDRIRPAVVRDRLDGREHPHHHRAQAADAAARHPAALARPRKRAGGTTDAATRAAQQTTPKTNVPATFHLLERLIDPSKTGRAVAAIGAS